MERFLPYSNFGNNIIPQQSTTHHLDNLNDVTSDNETANFVNKINNSNSNNTCINANEQKTNIRGNNSSINNCNNTLQMSTNVNSLFGGGNGGLYEENFRGTSSALAEMENKIAVQSSVFASNMLMSPQVDNSPFSHHSTVDTGQVGNNVNNAFQAEMAAALCQQQMLQAQMAMQAHCFTPQQQYNTNATTTNNNNNNSSSNNLIYGQSSSSSNISHFQQNLNSSPFGLQNYYSQQQQQSLLASNSSPSTAATSFLLPNVSNIVESTNISSLNRNTQKQQHNGNQNNRFGNGASISSLYGAATANLNSAEIDTDPRELERFAEHFKQRRIKLGVTQADVGKALAYLKMAGVGSLSQSTICRFESLTLSHNNMVALKPILQSWLERAEEATRQQAAASAAVEASGGIGGSGGDAITLQCIAAATAAGILPCTEKKRKRTSIAAPEKKLLEEFFKQQSRPTGDRIAAIADKLDLKKNVVRVWFCNQRQKHKRNQFRTSRVSCGISHMSSSSDLDQTQQKSPIQQIHLSHHQIQQNQYQNTLDNSLGCNPTTVVSLAAVAASMQQQLREQQRQFCHSSIEEREENSEESQIYENQRKTSPNPIDDNLKIENKNKIINKEEEQKNNLSNNTSVIQHTQPFGSGGMLFRPDNNNQLFYQQD